jgi:hypothetical protein
VNHHDPANFANGTKVVRADGGRRVPELSRGAVGYMINLIPRATVFAHRRAAFGRRCRRVVLVVGMFCLASTAWAEAPDEAPELVVRNLPRTVFADSKVTVELELSKPADEATRIAWSLEAVGGRALKRADVSIRRGAKTAQVTCEFPPLKETVVLPLRFRASLAKTAVEKPAAGAAENGTVEKLTVESKIWVFPRTPWIGKRKPETEPKLWLFDPAQTTGKLLTEAEVPFEPTANVAALGELRGALIVVGEGVDFREHSDLPSTLWRAAAAGNRVVCLSPAGGTLPFADESAEPRPSSFSLRRHDVVADFDARFDAELWTGVGALPTRRFAPRGEANVPSLEVTTDQGAWPWLEVRFAPTAGKLVVCGFGLIEGWETSPTPRYFLSHLLALDTPVDRVSKTSER